MSQKHNGKKDEKSQLGSDKITVKSDAIHKIMSNLDNPSSEQITLDQIDKQRLKTESEKSSNSGSSEKFLHSLIDKGKQVHLSRDQKFEKYKNKIDSLKNRNEEYRRQKSIIQNFTQPYADAKFWKQFSQSKIQVSEQPMTQGQIIVKQSSQYLQYGNAQIRDGLTKIQYGKSMVQNGKTIVQKAMKEKQNGQIRIESAQTLRKRALECEQLSMEKFQQARKNQKIHQELCDLIYQGQQQIQSLEAQFHIKRPSDQQQLNRKSLQKRSFIKKPNLQIPQYRFVQKQKTKDQRIKIINQQIKAKKYRKKVKKQS